MLNKQKGNKYEWVTHTWNPVKGCLHECCYCYLKDLAKRYGHCMTPRITHADLRNNLGEGNFIFVGSTSDMFGGWVPDSWIEKVLARCEKYKKNKYCFQTKNPERLIDFDDLFPEKSILGTTIESNRTYNDISLAPSLNSRVKGIKSMMQKYKIFLSIEPIIKFDADEFSELIIDINPMFVTIGADSKHHGLPEPTSDEICDLICTLKSCINVKQKKNLDRILHKGELKC